MRHIYLLSDATGETVERVLMAAMSQFRDVDIKLHRISRIRSREDILAALAEVNRQPGMIVYTLVDSELAEFLMNEAEAGGIETVDLITPLLFKLSNFFKRTPEKQPGLLYQLNAEYYRRVEAVNFTVKHDDGQEPRNLHKADIVFVGVSRTSKTPLSMYLAHKGYKVANVPLVKGIEPPKELFAIDQQRVFGLLIDARRLVELRSSRLRNLRQHPRGSYADYEQVAEEIEHCRQLFRRNPQWMVIDVSNKAVEETAAEVLKKLHGDERDR